MGRHYRLLTSFCPENRHAGDTVRWFVRFALYSIPTALALVVFVGCKPATAPDPGDTDDTDDRTVTDSDTDSQSTETADTGPTTPPIDCTILPPVPVDYQTLNAFQTAEDFDLDGDGYLVTISNGNLVGKDMSGDQKLVAPGMTAWSSAGTRVLPNGNWVVADVGAGSLVLWDDANQIKRTALSGLSYPNGVEVDSDNYAFVAENSGSRVRWVDTLTGDNGIVATGLTQPNGVILSPDEQTMYVGSFGGGKIYAIDRLGLTDWADKRVLVDNPGGDGGFDGINVDVCGNIYFTEYIAGVVWRITPDGQQIDKVVDLPSSWIPNMRWGHGIGGWERDVMYVSGFSEVFALRMEIDGKKHALLP